MYTLTQVKCQHGYSSQTSKCATALLNELGLHAARLAFLVDLYFSCLVTLSAAKNLAHGRYNSTR